MKSLVFLVTLMILSGLAQGGNDPKPASPAAPAKAEASPSDKANGAEVGQAANETDDKKKSDVATPIELKVKSSFEMEGDNRNPFWPIGWKPADASSKPSVEHNAGEISPTAFLVSSITMDPVMRFAIINGKTMQEGQQFGLQIGGQTYQLTVKAIEDGRVILSRRNQEIVVPLRRK